MLRLKSRTYDKQDVRCQYLALFLVVVDEVEDEGEVDVEGEVGDEVED
jgi:hypothetical protein